MWRLEPSPCTSTSVPEASAGPRSSKPRRRPRTPAHPPDAVLMDITMPEMDGLAALKEIRKLDPTARVAMVTAMGQQAIVMEALKAGAKDFVLKPFQPDRVLGALQKLLAA